MATPVIVGVGDIINRSLRPEDALEPRELMRRAILEAAKDTGLSRDASQNLVQQADLDVVATWTWPYDDLPSLLAGDLNISSKHKHYSPHGGNQPAKLLDQAARRIAYGQSKAAIVTGGEALASRTAILFCLDFN